MPLRPNYPQRLGLNIGRPVSQPATAVCSHTGRVSRKLVQVFCVTWSYVRKLNVGRVACGMEQALHYKYFSKQKCKTNAYLYTYRCNAKASECVACLLVCYVYHLHAETGCRWVVVAVVFFVFFFVLLFSSPAAKCPQGVEVANWVIFSCVWPIVWHCCYVRPWQ